jgi:hypothetical protein
MGGMGRCLSWNRLDLCADFDTDGRFLEICVLGGLD